ncbi:hypothetical protein CDAR_568861 [Caerostris darwini]|uniref:Uncharacterized protein n=1 Tax=Caerostris darwini TaxID=1538125 RepID=A0AAV4MHG4_9ARAC|nr:hypothetical protein CDAR_568861 [Caerostris darwini]
MNRNPTRGAGNLYNGALEGTTTQRYSIPNHVPFSVTVPSSEVPQIPSSLRIRMRPESLSALHYQHAPILSGLCVECSLV